MKKIGKNNLIRVAFYLALVAGAAVISPAKSYAGIDGGDGGDGDPGPGDTCNLTSSGYGKTLLAASVEMQMLASKSIGGGCGNEAMYIMNTY